MIRDISVIGVPIDLGADRRGVDMGPSAIRCAGMQARLERLGYTVHDEGDLVVRRPKTYGERGTTLKYLDEISRVCDELHNHVADAVSQGRFPLVIGGDHSIALGTIAGMLRHKKSIGVIWFDSHADMNTAETTPSGNIHGMSLAVALGIGDEKLVGIGGAGNKIDPSKAVIIGARSLDEGERKLIRELGVKVFTMHDIDRLGMTQVMEETIDIVTNGTDGVHLSLDLDGLDPEDAPGVGTPVIGGITYREGHLAMELLAEARCVISAEFVEVNPILDSMNHTAIVAVELMGSLFGEKIL
ncbi:arginase [Paenibacillus thermotolerans]|uniref:arginase n=1 Tax=Paenibacillus thermotolerans TaxID=3027807 RepID=UPI002368C792|nr:MULTISPECIES: arginase [unclassified Paenibacillus]